MEGTYDSPSERLRPSEVHQITYRFGKNGDGPVGPITVGMAPLSIVSGRAGIIHDVFRGLESPTRHLQYGIKVKKVAVTSRANNVQKGGH